MAAARRIKRNRAETAAAKLPRSCMTSSLPARLATEYQAGASVHELAQRYPHSERVIADVLREQGITIRSYAEQRQARMVQHGPVIAASYRQNPDMAALAKRFKMAPRLLRRVLADQGIALKPGRKPRATSLPENRRRDPRVGSLDVRELIEAGIVKPGRIRATYKGRSYEATLLPNGAVKLRDGSTHTLGGAAHRLIGSWPSGYLFWRSWAHRAWTPLDTLRREYLVKLAAAELLERLAAGKTGSPCECCDTEQAAVKLRWRSRQGQRFTWTVCAAHRDPLLGAVKLARGHVESVEPVA